MAWRMRSWGDPSHDCLQQILVSLPWECPLGCLSLLTVWPLTFPRVSSDRGQNKKPQVFHALNLDSSSHTTMFSFRLHLIDLRGKERQIAERDFSMKLLSVGLFPQLPVFWAQDQNWEPGSQSRSLTWVARTHFLEPSPLSPLDSMAGGKNQTQAPVGWHVGVSPTRLVTCSESLSFQDIWIYF